MADCLCYTDHRLVRIEVVRRAKHYKKKLVTGVGKGVHVTILDREIFAPKKEMLRSTLGERRRH